jgi:hypothetical protein
MRILFLARHHGYFRNYESVLRTLAERGHALHLAVERDEEIGGLTLVSQLAAEYPHVTFGEAPTRADDEWLWIAGRLRLGLDYLRYQHPVFDQARKLRSRARERTPGVLSRSAPLSEPSAAGRVESSRPHCERLNGRCRVTVASSATSRAIARTPC